MGEEDANESIGWTGIGREFDAAGANDGQEHPVWLLVAAG